MKGIFYIGIALAGLLALGTAGCSPQEKAEVKQQVAAATRHDVTWSGDVDDSVTVYVQGGKAWVDEVEGKPVENVVVEYHGALPVDRAATVSLSGKSGRGDVQVTQQPTKENNFTAAVRVIDHAAGRDHYKFVMTW
ncbi:MAG: hypothetical protein ABIY70_01035 [Capsulimonas sp.]|uniref:hypothetical protein n=1 Tax=Capsulimonas sp. TaxID=2494211 RepID=UPI0032661C25